MVNSKKTLVAEGSRRPKERGKTGLLFRAFFRRYVQPAVPDPRLWKRTKKQRDFLRGSEKFPRLLRYPEKCRTGCPDWIFGVYRPAESRCFFASFFVPVFPFPESRPSLPPPGIRGRSSRYQIQLFFRMPFPLPFSSGKAVLSLTPPGIRGESSRYQIQLFFRVLFARAVFSGKPALPLPRIRGENQWVPNPVVFSCALFHSRTSAPFRRADAFSPVRASDHTAAKSRTGTRFLCCCKGKWQSSVTASAGRRPFLQPRTPERFSPAFSAVHPDRTALLPIPAGASFPCARCGAPFPPGTAQNAPPEASSLRMSDPASRTGFPPDRLGCGPVAGYRRKLLQPGAGFHQGAGALCEIVAVTISMICAKSQYPRPSRGLA